MKAGLRSPRRHSSLAGGTIAISLLALALLAQRSAGAPAGASTIAPTRACEESGYCSLGVSQTWVGDIRESSKLREMLQAVAFKKELIIIIYMRQEAPVPFWEDMVRDVPVDDVVRIRSSHADGIQSVPVVPGSLQLHSELQGMGFAHHLYIGYNEKECSRFRVQFNRTDVSCVWDSSDFPSWISTDETALWHNRWKFMARATRLGYNVMSVDTDSMFFRDPYVNLKRRPLSKLNVMCNPEGGAYNCNGGFMYVQNARPDGPSTWVFMQVARSTLRRADDHFKFAEQWGSGDRNCWSFDQSLILDALVTAAVGRPIPEEFVRSCKQNALFLLANGTKVDIEGVRQNIGRVKVVERRAPRILEGPDPTWLARVGFRGLPRQDVEHIVGNLTVPNLNYGWPEDLGGRMYPEGPMGELSGAFMQMLKDDCPECPWWPEERPVKEDLLHQVLAGAVPGDKVVQAFHDPAIPYEVYGEVPKWMASSMASTRRGVVLGLRSPRQGYQSVGHVHAWHMQDSRAHKTMIRKAVGRYNWTLGLEVAHAYGHKTPYLYPHKVSRVLALSPHVDLSRTRNWAEFASIIAGMAQVAWLSNRVLLLPDLPCQTAWLHHPDSLADARLQDTMCIAPTFWHRPDQYPQPLVAIVDERGELVGGWARKLAGLYGMEDDEQTTNEGTGGSQRSSGPLLLTPWFEPGDGVRAGRRLLSSTVVEGTVLNTTEGFAIDRWWRDQRYVGIMPQLWDEPCTAGMHGIISPEFFHWLKHTPEGHRAKFEPTQANTVFLPDQSEPRLALQPPVGSGPFSSSAQVPPGQVVRPLATPGWSWFDVQVAVPSLDVARALSRMAPEPLVYLGHPVMVVPSAEEGNMLLEAPRAEVLQRLLGLPHANHHIGVRRSPNNMLNFTNTVVLEKCRCKALWMVPDWHDQRMVNLTHGLRGSVVQGHLTLQLSDKPQGNQNRTRHHQQQHASA